MRIGVLVNKVRDIAHHQATAMLIESAARRGHEVLTCGVADLSVRPDDRVAAQAWRVRRPAAVDRKELLAEMAEDEAAPAVLDELDALLIRTNPARDGRGWAQETALTLCRLLAERGVLVLNDPAALYRYTNKLYLSYLPAFVRPRMLISRRRSDIREFVESLDGDAVLKPLQGTHGRDVFLVRKGDVTNLKQIIAVVKRSGFVVAQECLPGAEAGDVRFMLLDGRPLEVGGQLAAVRRVPARGEFRSNVSSGGQVAPGEVTEGMTTAVLAIGERLCRDGIFLAGLDFIGDKVVEANVFSPGGFLDAQRFRQVDFIGAVVEAVERKAAGTA